MSDVVTLTLQNEIEAGRQTVRAEAYSMSIGEIVNLYRDKEIVIRPEFQRLFRWRLEQKSRLIESLLLGIPLPSIFVMQRDDNVWEVIDGLQRLSTILEFMGELRDEESGELQPPSRMQATAYLKKLGGVTFEENGDGPTLTSGQRLSFKRAKIDLKILLPESDSKAKYELFDRLNTGGSTPTPQEIRTAQLIMRDRSFYQWLEALRTGEQFQATIGISDRRYEEQYDLELVSRFFGLRNTTEQELKNLGNMDSFLTSRILFFTDAPEFQRDLQAQTFQSLFNLLARATGEDSFRRYDASKDRFIGAFSVSAFEAVTVGVAEYLQAWSERGADELRERVKELWSNTQFRSRSGSGVAASSRVPYTLPEAIRHFDPAK